jgi:hypothetical protein
MSATVRGYGMDECSTFNMILMFVSETSMLGTPRPKCVDTICKMENILAEMAARVMRAVIVNACFSMFDQTKSRLTIMPTE